MGKHNKNNRFKRRITFSIQIAVAILRLLEKEKAVTEGGGAAGVAAIIANALPELKGKT